MPRPAKISKTDVNVRPCKFADKPQYRFVVTVPKPGSRDRPRKFFATRGEAETYAESKRRELANSGTEGASLTQSQRAEYLDCAAKLAPYGVGLREAVDAYLPTLASRHRSVSVEKLCAEVIAAKERDGAGKLYLAELRTRLSTFAQGFAGRPVAGITTAELDDWLRSLPVGPTSRNNQRKVTRTAFSFAVARGYATTNPVKTTARAKVADQPPGVLSVEQASALLVAADDHLLPYLAIGLFAGLRRAELEKLDWSEVDLAAGHIEVTAKKSKTARRRLVTVEPNLRAWLAPLARPAGPVAPNNFRRRLEAARTAAGIDQWPDNCLRHSYGSFHVAAFGSAARTALEMGHTSATMLFSNYRNLVTAKDAARFWQISPAAGPSNVLTMHGAA